MDFVSTPLLPADNHFAVTGFLFGVVAFCLWLERFGWAKKVSAVFLVIVIPAVLSNLGLVPRQAPAYGFVSTYFVSAAIPLLLFKADLRRIFGETGRLMLGFLIAAAGTLVGCAVAVWLIPIGADAAAAAASIAGGYIGGSLNFIAVARSVGLDDPSRFSTVLGAEATAGLTYFAALSLVPRTRWFQRWLTSSSEQRAVAQSKVDASAAETAPALIDMSSALGISLLMCALGNRIAVSLELPSYSILFITIVAVVVVNVFPKAFGRIKGDHDLAMLMMLVFFAVFGAGTNLVSMLRDAPLLLAFAALIIVVHFTLAFGVGRALSLNPKDVLIGSNACLLGPPTAAAQASAEGWDDLVTPGVLVGLFGYVIGNFLGVGLYAVLT